MKIKTITSGCIHRHSTCVQPVNKMEIKMEASTLDRFEKAARAKGVTALIGRSGAHRGKLLIAGKWREGRGEHFAVLHPASNEEIGSVACATGEEIDDAVHAARLAFDVGSWPRMCASDRRRLLLRIADAIDVHGEELTLLQTLENGVPLSFSTTSRLSGHFLPRYSNTTRAGPTSSGVRHIQTTRNRATFNSLVSANPSGWSPRLAHGMRHLCRWLTKSLLH